MIIPQHIAAVPHIVAVLHIATVHEFGTLPLSTLPILKIKMKLQH
jgi:hypothetical protein